MPRMPTPGRPRPHGPGGAGAGPGGSPEALLAQARAAHGQGRLAEAERAYRALLTARPDLIEAYLGLADLASRQGRGDLAITLLTQAQGRDPKNPQVLLYLANARLNGGDRTGAVDVLNRALALKPRFPEAALLMGLAVRAGGDLAGAADWFRKALKARKDYMDAHLNLGGCLAALGDREEALKQFRRAVALAPKAVLPRFNLAQILFDTDRFAEAREACLKALTLDPELRVARVLLPKILDALEDYPAARAAWEDAVARHPRDAAVANDAALFMMLDGHMDRAEALHRQAVTLAPDTMIFAKNLIRHLLNGGAAETAEAEARVWLDRNGDHPEIRRALGDAQARGGRFEEALPSYLAAWEAAPEEDVIAYSLSSTGKMTKDNAVGDRILSAYGRALETRGLTADLAYAAGKVWDDRKDWDRAFDAFDRANRLQAAEAPYDIAAHEDLVEGLISVFSRDFWSHPPIQGGEGRKPILVVGLPRSGTTLTERIIASHPQAEGAGELIHFGRLERSLPWIVDATGKTPYPACVPKVTREALADFTAAYEAELDRVGPAAARVVDKMPQNFLRLGLFSLLYPQASVVHCARDVMDTCVSIYFQNFSRGHAYKNDLERLGRYARSYLRLMDHWRETLPRAPIEMDYAALVADQEGESRRLVAALGLDWDDAVLGFHESAGAVSTVSRWQVRQPIYGDSLARWRCYESHLDSLRRGLGLNSQP